MRALNNPSMLARAVVLPDTSASYPGDNAALVQVLSATCKVVFLVRAALGARYRRAVNAGSAPVDLVVFTQTPREMQAFPETIELPVSQLTPARHAAAETWRL